MRYADDFLSNSFASFPDHLLLYRFSDLVSRSLIVGALCLSGVCASAQSAESSDANDSRADSSSYRGGTIRLGAFAIHNMDARLYFGPTDLPIAIPINIEKDLGFKDSLLAFRSAISYRFSKHPAISVGYYRLDLDGTRRLERSVEIGGSEFDIGLDISSRYEEKILKLAYDFIFHDEGKVLLSVSPGIHLSSARFSIGARASIDAFTDLPTLAASEGASVTAPLPMFGGKLGYRITPKWTMILKTDIFFLNSGNQEGSLADSSILFEYQTDSAFGFGAGLNRFSLDLDIVNDDIRWDWESVYSGAYMYMTIKF
jgi:hypothetical protein